MRNFWRILYGDSRKLEWTSFNSNYLSSFDTIFFLSIFREFDSSMEKLYSLKSYEFFFEHIFIIIGKNNLSILLFLLLTFRSFFRDSTWCRIDRFVHPMIPLRTTCSVSSGLICTHMFAWTRTTGKNISRCRMSDEKFHWDWVTTISRNIFLINDDEW